MRMRMTFPHPRGGGGAGAPLPAAKPWRRASAKGAADLAGRPGGARVLVMPKRADEAGDHTHLLCFAEPSPAAQRDAAGGR